MSPASLARGGARIVHDARCELAEGPVFDPRTGRLHFFSILEGVLHSCDAEGGARTSVRLGEMASAAALTDDPDRLLVATRTGLWRLDPGTGEKALLEPLEADNPRTRSNDGRAAPDGSFWIGTMGLGAEDGAGAIYRYHPGRSPAVIGFERRVSIPNSIAFGPDGTRLYWCDTRRRAIMATPLDAGTGDPAGESVVHVDLSGAGPRGEDLNPDGSVVDGEGCLWNAQWGASRVARYDPDGAFMGAVPVPVAQPSCPAFGGDDMTTLFVTTAWQGMGASREADAGCVFAFETRVRGRAEAIVAPLPEPRAAVAVRAGPIPAGDEPDGAGRA